MAKRKKVKAFNKLYKRLYSVILRYGSAKIILERNGKEYGQRLVKKSGECQISYAHRDYFGQMNSNYKKRYQLSCFYEDSIEELYSCCVKKSNLARTLRYMYEHDRNYVKIKEVQYGPRFKKRMKLK